MKEGVWGLGEILMLISSLLCYGQSKVPLEGGRVRNLYHKYGGKERENNVGNLRRERRCLARRSKRVRPECKKAEIK